MPRALLRARSSVGCWDVETLHPSPREAQPGGQGAGARKGGEGLVRGAGSVGPGDLPTKEEQATLSLSR